LQSERKCTGDKIAGLRKCTGEKIAAKGNAGDEIAGEGKWTGDETRNGRKRRRRD
jgi:hypothetical protein